MTLASVQIPDWLKRVLQIGVAASLLAVVWRAADGPEAARSLASADWRWLSLAFAALTLQLVLSALRWRMTARQLGISIGRMKAIGEYYLSQMVNQSLPGGMIGDASRAVRSGDQAGLVAAGQAVVFERLSGQVAMFALLAMAFVATIAIPGGLDWPREAAALVATLLGIALALTLCVGLAGRMPGAIGRNARSLHDALRRALLSRAALPGQIGFSTGTTLCNVAAFSFCAHAVGVEISFAATAALVPLILTTMLIPVSISGWGLREGAAAALLPLAGATASGAVAASVAFGLTFIASILPGLVVLWRKPEARLPKIGQTGAGHEDGTIRRARSG